MEVMTPADILDKESETQTSNIAEPAPVYDNFYSPENRTFYSQSPYQALDPTKHQIRLLKLVPSGDDGLLSFTLLDNCPLETIRSQYTALSYCAGNPRKTQAIRINGLEFNAFANLGQALKEVIEYWRRLDMAVDEQLLWADQICINQSDPDERSHQVGQMRDIYSASSVVLIALSVPDSDQNGCDGISWLLDLRVKLRNMNCEGMDDAVESTCRQDMLHQMVRSFHSPTFQEGYLAFYQVLGSPWWRRAWIHQEFIVAQRAIFLCGARSIAWEDLAPVVKHLVDADYGLSRAILAMKLPWKTLSDSDQPSGQLLKYVLDSRNTENLSRLQSLFTFVQRKHTWMGPGDLKIWLECGRLCQTSDTCNRIYAFLDLAHPHYNIVPDYSPSNTLENLVLEVSKNILLAERRPNIFAHVRRRKAYSEKHKFPSCSPNWAAMNFDDTTLRLRPKAALPYQRLSENFCSPNFELATVPILISDSVLRLQGIKLDTVATSLKDSTYIFHPTLVTTPRKFSILWRLWESKMDPKDSLWCFRGSSLVSVLRPVSTHWVLLFSTPLDLTIENGTNWSIDVTEMIIEGDYDGLLTMEGLKEEVIEIH